MASVVSLHVLRDSEDVGCIIRVAMRRVLAIGVALYLLVPGLAVAKPKVALVAFDGDKSGELNEVVAELLDGEFSVSGAKQTGRTLDKLGLDTELSDKDLKKLANELDADAIVRGDLSKKGARKLLHVKLFVKGKKVRGFKVEFASARSEKFREALKDKMIEKLAGKAAKKKVEVAAEPERDDEDPLGGSKKKGKKADRTDRTEKTSTAFGGGSRDSEETDGADRDDKADEDRDEDSDEDEPKRKRTARADIDDEDIDGGLSASATVERSSSRGRAANKVAVRVDLGASMSARQLKFNSRAFEQAPKPYANSPVAGARISGEIFPLAFGNPHSLVAGIGFAGHYDQTLKLNLQSTAQPGTDFPVEQKHWSLGARMRVGIGSRPTSPTVTLAGGYFHRKFKVDRSRLMEGNIIDLPDVFYQGYNAGLEFRIPILQQVAFLAGGKAIFVTNTGQIQQLYSYGQAKVTAGEGMAGLDIVIAGRIGLRLTGEIAQMGFAFTGNGELTYNRDRDPTTPDVGGASDRYYGGTATLAVLY